MEADSIEACVTDPPYHLTANKKGGSGFASENLDSPAGRSRATTGFMGKAWDGGDIAFQPEIWREVFRVLKPGAHLLAFGGTRTYHRMVCAIEDAGFEIRDQIGWLYGSGFPKSLDVSKAIDRAAGVERKVVGVSSNGSGAQPNKLNNHGDGDTGIGYMDGSGKIFDVTAPATEAARQWEGWGTALKPAWEPIVLARKPLVGTVAENVQEFGTGAINVDGCRVPVSRDDRRDVGRQITRNVRGEDGWGMNGQQSQSGVCVVRPEGRWPANIIHDGSDEVLAGFPAQAGAGGKASGPTLTGPSDRNCMAGRFGGTDQDPPFYADNGSAARFFYCAKATRSDRNDGLGDFEEKPLLWSAGTQNPGSFQAEGTHRAAKNAHPTVKPTALMRYLCRLITPPGGVVLDPFAGSGSTGRGAILEGFEFVGIEREAEYCEIARARLEAVKPEEAPEETPDLFSRVA